MSVASVTGAEPARASVPFRHVVAVSVGNALGFYDFLTYVYFAVYISKAFFPSGDPTAALLSTYAASFVGFLARPVGAMIIGPMGDRIGRKAAMTFSFALMGVGVIGVAVTPTYAQIGIAAPIVVVLFRMVQGFALGGEVGPTTAYLIEAAEPKRRGFYSSLQAATQDTGALVAGVIGTILAASLTADQLQSWGWRAAFLIGASIVPIGLWMRRSLPETLHTADDAALAPDATVGDIGTKMGLRPFIRVIVCGLLMLAAATIGNYTISYMTTFALTVLHLPAVVAFGVIIVNGGFAVLFEPVSGWLSDRFGRKVVMLLPGIVMLATILPAFWLISAYRTVFVFYAAVAWVSSLLALNTTPIVTVLTETLPPRVRSGVVSTVYAFAISIFGGSTQFMLTWLLATTQNPLVPAYYWTGALIVGLTAMALVKESAPVKLARRP